jgi:hypothetical protein
LLKDIILLLDLAGNDGVKSSDYEEGKTTPKPRRMKPTSEALVNTWAPKDCGKFTRIFPHENIDVKQPPKSGEVSEMKSFLQKVKNCYK